MDVRKALSVEERTEQSPQGMSERVKGKGGGRVDGMRRETTPELEWTICIGWVEREGEQRIELGPVVWMRSDNE